MGYFFGVEVLWRHWDSAQAPRGNFGAEEERADELEPAGDVDGELNEVNRKKEELPQKLERLRGDGHRRAREEGGAAEGEEDEGEADEADKADEDEENENMIIDGRIKAAESNWNLSPDCLAVARRDYLQRPESDFYDEEEQAGGSKRRRF